MKRSQTCTTVAKQNLTVKWISYRDLHIYISLLFFPFFFAVLAYRGNEKNRTVFIRALAVEL